MSDPLLSRTAALAEQFLASLRERPVGATATREGLAARLGGALPAQGLAPLEVVEGLAAAANDGGLIASAGPRYFGFVIGGSVPAALAADWLVSAWDQDAGLYACGPAAAVVEDVAAGWLLDLFGLPASASVGFVTGGQMANFTGIAAGRHAVLARAGYDVEEDGLRGAPPVHVVVGAEAHVTILTSLRLLGLGSGRAVRVAADGQGRMQVDALRRTLASFDGPTIVCAQAGNVNTGAFDPVGEISDIAHEHGAWVHVDGAFGLWAAIAPARAHLFRGVERADSWATDGHKWLNVPYDSGIAIVRDRVAHKAAMTGRAAYLVQSDGAERDPQDWTPEFSRRARGFPVYAALRSLGREGLTALVERCCRLATHTADRLRAGAAGAGVEVRILNEVVLNQVLVRFEPKGGDAGAFTRAVVGRVQREGTCWMAGTRWHELDAMRISISNWSTTEEDIDRSAKAILACARAEAEAGGTR
ncbi:MAG TPA: aminotransferase class V-fold PLP-dependent enzyme [Vicinamibacteria bacterium]|nr:aminotransferase class V-fold PLP-dependent enzyme [Vicinamibacteria bacterium]